MLHILKERFMVIFQIIKAVRLQLWNKGKECNIKKKRTNTIIWEKNSEADGYIIYYSKKIDGSYKKLKTYNSRNKLTYTHKKLTNGVAYYYKIQAYKNYKAKNFLEK